MVRLFNENGEVIIRAKFTRDVHQQTLFIYPNHQLINKFITFTPSEYGTIRDRWERKCIKQLTCKYRQSVLIHEWMSFL